MTIRELNKKLQSFNIQSEALKAIDKTKDVAVQKNRDQLFLDSQRSDGSYLQKYRDLTFYAVYKHRINPAPGFGAPDLRNTGAFQNRMFAVVRGGFLHIDSKDGKTAKLVDQYGSHIFGLTKKSLNEYATQAVRIEFSSRLKIATGLR